MDYRAYDYFGSHKTEEDGREYVTFTVWAPNAKEVYLTGDFNDWNDNNLPLHRIDNGNWTIDLEGINEFDSYKYRIITWDDNVLYKADPYAFHAETPPKSASKYYDLKGFEWKDEKWISQRNSNLKNSPLNIYELNLYTWKRKENGEVYSYRDLADELIPYIKEMAYTHIELMPIMEHPFYGSWGYQATGYYAPTSRHGTPKDFMYFINECHKKNIGVILDWVPADFCRDDHGLRQFDGRACFESSNTYKADNDQWGTVNFDYSKDEVVNFLISNAIYWHEYYHIDGMRIDAVAYMIYLNFTGKDIKNKHGGNENLEAVEFIKKLNFEVFKRFPDTMMIAEESSAWPLVTYPTDQGGLGFNYKWNMGWMNDILAYMEMDPIYRKDHQNTLTFTMTYAFSENYILPLSHDEVVHGKKSLLNKMPGSYEEKFANLRLLYQYMYAHPGKKLLFMGGEFGQFIEWKDLEELDWFLLDYQMHSKMRSFVIDLNKLYKKETCLFWIDNSFEGYQWIEHENHQESIIAFERIGKDGDKLIAVFNFTPVDRPIYPIGVDEEGSYKVILNSDHAKYGGSTKRNKPYKTKEEEIHGRKHTLRVDLPGLSALYLKLNREQ